MSDLPPQPDQRPLPPRLDARQERIHRLLGLLIGSGPAAFFRDACFLMQPHSQLTSTTHLVGHLLREIESAVRDIMVQRPIRKVAKSNHRSEVEQILGALDIDETETVAETWLRFAEGSDDYALHRHAHRDALAEPRSLSDEFGLLWTDMQRLLELVLTRFEARYFDLVVREKLDSLLAEKNPNRGHASRFKNRVPNSLSTHGYFFDRLDNPAWLVPLRAEGFSDRPPKAVVNDDSGTVSSPPWPPMRYLCKMANRSPDEVVQIAEAIPSTNNVYVHADLLEIGLTVSPELAAWLVVHLKHGIGLTHGSVLFTHKLGQFLLHLSSDPKQRKVALDLARCVFAVLPENETPEGQAATRPFSNIRTRLDFHSYDRIAKETTEALASRCGLSAFQMFCDLLEEAVSLMISRPKKEGRDDWSQHWCEKVESPSSHRDVRSVLVSAVRDSAQIVVEKEKATIHDVVQLLEARRWSIFDRISLHLINICPEDRLAAEQLLKREYFDSDVLRQEYNALLKSTFRSLGCEEQNTILGWIEEGPDLTACGNWSEQEALEYAHVWRRDYLHLIRDSLPPLWHDRYDALIEGLGVPQPAPPSFSVSWGDQSPIDVDQLCALSLTEIIDYLDKWKPTSDDVFVPSQEGLIRTFGAAVAKEPSRFALSVHEFAHLDSGFVTALLSGLREASKKTWQPEWWPPVLAFCRTFCSQPHLLPSSNDDDEPQLHLFRSIAVLVSAGLDDSDTQFPIALRERVWETLLPLTEYPDPPTDGQGLDGEADLDLRTRSYNSVRGEAIHAVIKYALWVRRDANRFDPGHWASLDHVPEVRKMLDKHLDVTIDSAPAIRSVYGEWFACLCLLDEAWAKSRVDTIFPSDSTWAHLGDAAWQSYVAYCNPYNSVFPLLRKQYERAIVDYERQLPYQVGRDADHRKQLGEHVMLFYGRGVLGLHDDDGLLELFFEKATIEDRCHALAFVGRRLEAEDGPVPPEVTERFRQLWLRRIAALRGVPNCSERAELKAFGWWFLCDNFERRWVLDQLKASIDLYPETEPDHEVVARLAAMATKFPQEAVACLAVLCDGIKDGWTMSLWHDNATTILRTALDDGPDAARSVAIDRINRLVARGYHTFRELLE